jgi:hypothetical protein
MPAIKVNGGLKVGKDKGVHDSDYYLEVTAVNKAKLTTILSKKVKRDRLQIIEVLMFIYMQNNDVVVSMKM